MTSFPLFTSIKPPSSEIEHAYLRECIHSWRMAGFEPVAVNGPSEVKALREPDLPVEFAPLPTDGKPRIGAILSAIRNRGVRFAGIINSDCRIIGYPDFAANVRTGLERTVRVAWRLDIGKDRPTACLGYDAYFFDAGLLPEDDCGYCLGGSWWDYWFPFACAVEGAKIETFPLPILTHKIHPLNYDTESEIEGARRFWTALKRWYADGRDDPSWPFSQHQLQSFHPGELSASLRSWIGKDAPSVSLVPPELKDLELALHSGGYALLTLADQDALVTALAGFRAAPLQSMLKLLRHQLRPPARALAMARTIKGIAGLQAR